MICYSAFQRRSSSMLYYSLSGNALLPMGWYQWYLFASEETIPAHSKKSTWLPNAMALLSNPYSSPRRMVFLRPLGAVFFFFIAVYLTLTQCLHRLWFPLLLLYHFFSKNVRLPGRETCEKFKNPTRFCKEKMGIAAKKCKSIGFLNKIQKVFLKEYLSDNCVKPIDF